MTESSVRPVGISFPTELLAKVDSVRGDTNRSKFIVKIIEAELNDEDFL